ncbi:hypothetical protein BIY24_03155 [Halobacteriovorax marinus]|uniref:hypothetical protein n=1 Tax=Halobacteriovorax marinus TaxID=97084 RepID=UPI000BC2E941|nr:hypothetical protein [Halobacteriovorax marinus]ATH06967.1 hypothetical protein BIY24_03155 [Halobacteriovorax marinus]
MEFSLGLIKSENQFLLKSFDAGTEDNGKVLDLSELKNSNLQALFYDEEQIENEDLKATLLEDSRFFPIRSLKEINSDYESFQSLSLDEVKNIFSRVHDNWLLQNNVTLLEELFKVITHLNGLWPNDRTTFFEELWFILKSNLGAKSVRIIFNDIQIAKKENEKNKLIQVKVEGERLPNPTEGGVLEAKIMSNYEKDFNNTFDIAEYSGDKGQLVITATIKKSPVVIMAEVYELSRMQKAILSALFTGLSENIQ